MAAAVKPQIIISGKKRTNRVSLELKFRVPASYSVGPLQNDILAALAEAHGDQWSGQWTHLDTYVVGPTVPLSVSDSDLSRVVHGLAAALRQLDYPVEVDPTIPAPRQPATGKPWD